MEVYTYCETLSVYVNIYNRRHTCATGEVEIATGLAVPANSYFFRNANYTITTLQLFNDNSYFPSEYALFRSRSFIIKII